MRICTDFQYRFFCCYEELFINITIFQKMHFGLKRSGKKNLFSKVNSGGILGIEGYLVGVEADVSGGLPGFSMVGYLSSEVKEARDRVQTAMKNSGFQLLARKITVNLSPADVRKAGTAFDLPVAIAVLAAFGVITQEALNHVWIAGELGLDGRIKGIHGVLPMVMAARDQGIRFCFLPEENIKEGKLAEGCTVIGVRYLKELVELLNCPEKIKVDVRQEECEERVSENSDCDFSQVRGQLVMRRAVEIGAAGRHNILLAGAAGTGKSMIAKRIPTILPSLTKEESLEISKVYSVCGMLKEGMPLITSRPFRSPHHTITPQAFIGGGNTPRPGEISLASGGVLFLDEMTEFQHSVLELLRQPMEDRAVNISRLNGSCSFPADTMIVAAINPCPCGFYPDKTRCRCTDSQIRKYLSKISKPIWDRIDICAEAAPPVFSSIRNKSVSESSAAIRKRVETAAEIQKNRFKKEAIYFNCQMGKKEIEKYCMLGKEEEDFLFQLFNRASLSTRGCDKVLKVARTIADLEGEEQIKSHHLCEAAGYRTMEEKYWGGIL